MIADKDSIVQGLGLMILKAGMTDQGHNMMIGRNLEIFIDSRDLIQGQDGTGLLQKELIRRSKSFSKLGVDSKKRSLS